MSIRHPHNPLTPWSDVAKKYNAAHGTNYTYQAVWQIYKRAERKLRKAIEATAPELIEEVKS